MNDIYKSKFDYKEKKVKNNSFITRCLLSIILFLSTLIFVNYNSNNLSMFKRYFIDKNFDYSKYTKIYNKYFGDVLPIQEQLNDEMVFNEKITYKSIDNYYDGFNLDVGSSHLVPIIQSGLIVYVGEKENYGNTVIIQGIDGVDIWYSNINLNNYSLYDYVNKGNILGETINDNLYLVFNKDGNFLSYEEFID